MIADLQIVGELHDKCSSDPKTLKVYQAVEDDFTLRKTFKVYLIFP